MRPFLNGRDGRSLSIISDANQENPYHAFGGRDSKIGRLPGNPGGGPCLGREKTMKRYEQAISLLLLCIMAGFIVWGLHAMGRKSEQSSALTVEPDNAVVAEQ